MFTIAAEALPLDVLPDPHLVLDADGVLLAANEAFDRRLLAEPRALRHLAAMSLSRGEISALLEGERRYYAASWTPCTWQGTPARLVRLLDISEERRHTKRVEQAVRSLEETLDALPASLILVDERGVIVSANARWHISARMNGLAMPNAGIGTNYLEVCDRAAAEGDDEAAAVAAGLREVLARKSLAFETEYAVQPEGAAEPLWFRLVINALDVHAGAVVQHYDMSVAHQLEAQLRQSQKMEALGQLTGGIAHDFNNILTIILAHAELLLTDDATSVAMREELVMVLQAAERGADLVRKLMAFGRREPLRVRATRLEQTLQEILVLLRRVLPETISVHSHTPADLPAVMADPAAVQQVLLNLATNARDAMRDHGGELRMLVRVEEGPARHDGRRAGQSTGHHVVLTVTDTGCGMSAETLARVFEPFYTTKGLGEGTGLGMSMVYGLMEQMGGQVSIDSQSGQGTSVRLRFAVAAESPRPRTESPVFLSRDHGTADRLLLVEDDDAIRAITARILRRAGYNVTEAHSGNEAAAMLEAMAALLADDGGADAPERPADRLPFALVVSDVVMPDGDGGQVLRAVRRFVPATRIIWVTGYAGGGSGEGPVQVPCDAPIIQKPWTAQELLTQVRTVLEGPPNVPPDDSVPHDPHRSG